MSTTGTGNGSPAVVVKEPIDNSGRIVMLTHAANYNAGNWYTNPSMMKLFTNSAKWATRCQ